MKHRVEVKNGGVVVWNVNRSCRRIVGPIAKRFGLSIEDFFDKKTRHQLPGQINKPREFEDAPPPAGFSIPKVSGSRVQRRIERAAAFASQQLEMFLWDSIASSVAACEDDMILDPKTGDVIGDDMDIDRFIIRESRQPKRQPSKAKTRANEMVQLRIWDDETGELWSTAEVPQYWVDALKQSARRQKTSVNDAFNLALLHVLAKREAAQRSLLPSERRNIRRVERSLTLPKRTKNAHR